jgi:hypothetical protein
MSDSDSSHRLVLPFDTDDPEFRRGVEAGALWAHLEHEPYVAKTVHMDNAERVMRIAEVLHLPFTAHPAAGRWADEWIDVTIGYADWREAGFTLRES